ncbi:MAG: acyl carrier protein [Nitrospira sp.]|nr:acyl carrier protein [Nitrospira sp.]
MGILKSKESQLDILSHENNLDKQVGSYKQLQSVEAIQTWLVSKLSEMVEIESEDIDIQQPFAYYGLDSRQAAILSGELEEWLGRRLAPTLVYDYPSIGVLARHLAVEL